MANNKRACMNCKLPMKNVYVVYKGIKLEARQCPKCKEKIFTEELTMKAINKMEANREVTNVFNLDSNFIF